PPHTPRPATPFPYTTLFRSCIGVRRPNGRARRSDRVVLHEDAELPGHDVHHVPDREAQLALPLRGQVDVQHDPEVLRVDAHLDQDRKSTRLNSSHEWISYAV